MPYYIKQHVFKCSGRLNTTVIIFQNIVLDYYVAFKQCSYIKIMNILRKIMTNPDETGSSDTTADSGSDSDKVHTL